MEIKRLGLRLVALLAALALGAYLFACATSAQTGDDRPLRPDTRRALRQKLRGGDALSRRDGYSPQRAKHALAKRPPAGFTGDANAARVEAGVQEAGELRPRRVPARPARRAKLAPPNGTTADAAGSAPADARPANSLITRRIAPGTSLAHVLHTSQLSTTSTAGSIEQFFDSGGDLVADQRTTFDTRGGAFDVAVGRTGTRYEVFTATDDRGTSSPHDDRPIGVLVNAFDTNGDFVRDSSATYDLHRDFGLVSAVAVVAGTSRAGREFVVVSSSGYYNYGDPGDPDNEPTAGVVLLVRDAFTGGFDPARSRTLVAPGSQRLNNANALALLPDNDLLVADFDSNELRVVRDTDDDGLPDTLDPSPYYSYRYSNDAPLDVAANSRGVVFSHSVGGDTVMLALYDRDGDGYAGTEEVVVEGLSIDNNLIYHGLTVEREGTVYVIEDALGQADSPQDGGNGGTPLVDAFPDPALNGILRDGALYVTADNPTSQALSGLAFGDDPRLAPVARLTMTNSASLRGDATRDGLATILGSRLTGGRRGATAAEASARGVRVTVEGRAVPVHSFSDDRLNIHVPAETGTGPRSVVVSLDGVVVAAADASVVEANPGLFTADGTGAGEAVALLTSGMRYTAGPFPPRFGNQPSVFALFGTGWRNSLPLTVSIGGRAATVEFAGATSFPGLDQLNVRLPDGVTGIVPVVVTTSGGATSRADVTISVR